jgi:hypothetical protein
MDSQSVANCRGRCPSATSGYDGHKRVNGRKRHILTDTIRLLKSGDRPTWEAAALTR